jgi:hypothetical protein
MRKLKKVISGGQTGADVTGLICAKALGLETGGTAPKGWKVDGGVNPSLGPVFGLVECKTPGYPARTVANVRNSDVTIWFGKTDSPGFFCTLNAAKNQKRSFFVNPYEIQLEYLCNTYRVWNVAGNRERVNPEVVSLVQGAFYSVAHLIGKPAPNFVALPKD